MRHEQVSKEERKLGALPSNFSELNKTDQEYWINKINEEREETSTQKILSHLQENPEEFKEYIKAKKEQDRLNLLRNHGKGTGVGPAAVLNKDSFLNDLGQFNNYLALAKEFVHIHPLYFDKSKMWWRWDWKTYKWERIDETTLLIDVDNSLKHGGTVQSKTKGEILESLRREARRKEPKETPNTWVQFKDKIIDISTGEEINPTPQYFLKNPIKWNTSAQTSTPKIDKLFTEWVGEENVKILKQIIAYSALPDYPIHRIFVLLGAGTNGKSTFLRLLANFIGQEHIASTELDLIQSNRFEISKLYGKLVCQLGETNDTDIKSTSILKKISGGDLVSFEFKGKDAFDAYNYAKILIATNTLPITHDKTDGFFRRWVIIDFPNQFHEEKDILASIPDSEYECLATQCVLILQELFVERKFHNEGNLKDRRKRYEDKSNPLVGFIQEMCVQQGDVEVPVWQFIESFQTYLSDRGYMSMSKHKIGKLMRNEGYESIQQRRNGNNWKFYVGIDLKRSHNDKSVSDVSNVALFPTSSLSERKLSRNHGYNGYNGNKNEKNDYFVAEPCKHGQYYDEDCLLCKDEKEELQ